MTTRMVRLGDFCHQDRTTVRPGERPDLRYIGLETIKSGTGQFQDGELSKTPDVPQANSFHFGPEHVLYGKLRPYLNKVALPEFEGKCSTEIIPLRPVAALDRRYLAYFLRSADTVAHISERTAGARMPRADMDFVLGLQLPLPSLDEQRRIIDLLSRAEGIVRLRREAEKKADEIIPALFLDMFGDPATNPKGWRAARLSDVTLDVRNGFNPSKQAFGDGVPFVTVNDLYAGLRIDVSSAQRVAAPAEVIKKYRLQRGDLCFVRSSVKRSGVGMAAVFDEEIEAVFGGFVIRVRLDPIVEPIVACAMFQTPSVRKLIVESAGTGTITNINQPSLMALPIVIPSPERQQQFVQHVLAIEGVQRQQTLATATAESIFNAFLARAFSTETRRDRQDHAEQVAAA